MGQKPFCLPVCRIAMSLLSLKVVLCRGRGDNGSRLLVMCESVSLRREYHSHVHAGWLNSQGGARFIEGKDNLESV